MITESTLSDLIQLELNPTSRSFMLRDMYWEKSHNKALVRKQTTGSGENTLTGHAKDFATLLEASDPFIQPYELIVGTALAIPQDRKSIDLGYYNSHYPPGHETILHMGLAGIRDNARERLKDEKDPGKRDFLSAVEISYDAACRYVKKYADYAEEMAASEPDHQRKEELKRLSAVCHELATGLPMSASSAAAAASDDSISGCTRSTKMIWIVKK